MDPDFFLLFNPTEALSGMIANFKNKIELIEDDITQQKYLKHQNELDFYSMINLCRVAPGFFVN